MTEPSSASGSRQQRPRRRAGDAKQYGRSAISNGALLDGIDGRSAVARRYRDALDSLMAEYSAHEERDTALCRGAARLMVMLEGEDAKLVRGEPVSLGDIARATSRLQRILFSVGIGRDGRERAENVRIVEGE